MSGRGRTEQGLNEEWDQLREEFQNSSYEPQYNDSDINGGVQLDHCRLYIRNIPKGLSDDGLRTAFSKYGTLTEMHFNKDPMKRYALVRYETAGEAKLAMTKLNNTEPLRLTISIAHKPKKKQDNHQRYNGNNAERNYGNTSKRSIRDDNSVSSKDRSFKQFEDMGDTMDDSLPNLGDEVDSDTKLKGLQLELQRLQVQEQTVLLRQQLLQLEAARKKNLNQSGTSSNRCILPDGRIVVQNVKDRNLDSRDVDGSFAAGAGDSLTLPALQRVGSRACVACGSAADAYCAQCGVTPYCGVVCQRRDWHERHRGVCHNLARLSKKNETAVPADQDLSRIPTAPPLRRPRSPAREQRRDDYNEKKSTPTQNNNNNRPSRNSNSNNNWKNNNKPNYKNAAISQDDVDEDWGAKNKVTPKPTPVQEEVKATPPPAKVNGEVKVTETAKVAETPKVVETPKAVKAPASVSEVTPAKKLVPKNYLVELLSVGEQILLSVEATAADCRSKKAGFVCLSMSEKYQTEYQALCETYVVACEKDSEEFTPRPGDSFSFLNTADGGWYRARCVSAALGALLDANRVVPLAGATVRRLRAPYDQYPEFCCILSAPRAKMGDNFMATIVSKTADVCHVSLVTIDSGESCGDGEISRWLPTIDYPTLASPLIQPQIPEVARPPLKHNSRVVLVDATSLEGACVRPADHALQRAYDTVVQDVVLYGRNATPLKEPPLKGQVVVAKFTDGLHYRALCKRTSVKQNKYMLEYIDYGNTEITQLENLYPCPPNLDLSAAPTEASFCAIQCGWAGALTPRAVEYITDLKDNNTELTLTLPSGSATAPSGSPVLLTVVKNNESVNKKLEELCKPEWKKIEDKGGDVVDLECLNYKVLEYPELPVNGCELDISDVTNIESGVLSGCKKNLPHSQHVVTTLTQRIADYCSSELGKEPYLPKNEELCIAPCHPFPQWFRAVLIEHMSGSPTAKVCYVDYGNVDEIPVTSLRKMLPEFVKGEPALAIHLEIRDFPKPVNEEMLLRGLTYMKTTPDGRGTLTVTKCEKIENGMYIVDAPDLIRAMLGK